MNVSESIAKPWLCGSVQILQPLQYAIEAFVRGIQWFPSLSLLLKVHQLLDEASLFANSFISKVLQSLLQRSTRWTWAYFRIRQYFSPYLLRYKTTSAFSNISDSQRLGISYEMLTYAFPWEHYEISKFFCNKYMRLGTYCRPRSLRTVRKGNRSLLTHSYYHFGSSVLAISACQLITILQT